MVWTDALGIGGTNDMAEAGGLGTVEGIVDVVVITAFLFKSD